MVNQYRQWAIAAWGAVAFLSVCTALAYQAGFRINNTASMPMGLYRGVEDHAIERGDFVLACPVSSPVFREAFERHYIGKGNCPGGKEELLKPVVAIAGDYVTVDANGILVNDRRLPLSRALTVDSGNRPLHSIPVGIYRMKGNEVWLLSNHSPKSFDSRYFGALPTGSVQHTVKPILTW